MSGRKETAAFICVKDTLDGAYPSLVLGINAARQQMETKIFYSFMGLNLVVKGGIERAKYIPPGGSCSLGKMVKQINDSMWYSLYYDLLLVRGLYIQYRKEY